jgi:hypothetical protein
VPPVNEPDPKQPTGGDGRSGALVGLIVALVLVLGGLFLWHVLHGVSALQDCVMSGRTNCAPIDSATPADR